MSGIDAVKRIVETEAQARRIVEEAKARSQEILSSAAQDAERVRQDVLASTRSRREEILRAARANAEAEASRSDEETTQQLEGYRKVFESRKDLAVEKAVELVLRG
ncbi:MAG TPA: hypothetical protein VIK88_01175 [Candidatus Bathyarchaeia archaeon]